MVYKEGMDQWLLAVTSDLAAKGSAKDLEVAGAGPVHCHFFLPPSFLTMCSSERCLSLYVFRGRIPRGNSGRFMKLESQW